MNTTQNTHVVPRAQNVNLATLEERPQPSQRVLRATFLRYALLVAVALLLTSLTYVMFDLIHQTETEMDKVYPSFGLLPLR